MDAEEGAVDPRGVVSRESWHFYRDLAREAIRKIPSPPEGAFARRGVVIPAGGRRYFTCAWVCVQMLRRLGCSLPIELWYLGETEMSDEMKEVMAPLGVECVDAFRAIPSLPAGASGWQLGVLALVHCRFREVLMLDADNVPAKDPTFLFDTPQFSDQGAVFWPDLKPLANGPIWNICEVPFRVEPSFESGQILVDKIRCWRELHLAAHYNEHAHFYYRHIWGDKDTYHLAWRRLGTEYTMVPAASRSLRRATILQHDFEGDLLFQHRVGAKWDLHVARNTRIPGFRFELQCIRDVSDLAARWSGRIPMRPPLAALADQLTKTRTYELRTSDGITTTVQFFDAGKLRGILNSNGGWRIFSRNDGLAICINLGNGISHVVVARPDGSFGGTATLTPVPARTVRIRVPVKQPRESQRELVVRRLFGRGHTVSSRRGSKA